MVKSVRNHTLLQVGNIVMHKFLGYHKSYMRSAPLWLITFITSRCTLECNMCPYKSPNRSEDLLKFDDMSFSTFKKIVDKFRYTPYLGLTGGEPFLNKDIFVMLKYANAHRMYIEVPTNGTIIHDQLNQIVRSPISTLNVSLDAYDSNGYKKMRGASKEVFDTVIENVIRLVEKRINSTVT